MYRWLDTMMFAAAWPSYNLTTVRQCSGQMVNITIDILLEEIENENSQPKIGKNRWAIDNPGSSRKVEAEYEGI